MPIGAKVRESIRKRAFNRAMQTSGITRRANIISALRGQFRPARRRNLRTAGLLGIEHKYLDQYKTSTLIPGPTDASGGEFDPATTLQLNAVAQGDTATSRDGKNYIIDSLFIKGTIKRIAQANLAAGALGTGAFVAVVLDTQTNGAQLNSEDVYTNPEGSAEQSIHPLRNLNFAKRFRVLWSKKFDFVDPNLSWDGTNIEANEQQQSWEVNITNMALKVETKGTGANVTDVVDNSLHVIAYSYPTNQCKIQYNSRIRFRG